MRERETTTTEVVDMEKGIIEYQGTTFVASGLIWGEGLWVKKTRGLLDFAQENEGESAGRERENIIHPVLLDTATWYPCYFSPHV